MSMSWLPLTEYSSKYKVSISTLRRRIKADDITFSFEDGKYLISDEPLSTHQGVGRTHRSSQVDAHRPSPENTLMSATEKPVEKTTEPVLASASLANVGNGDEPILTAANRLLTELKKAYSLILQEKEEQILHLKEEVSDLKTLVRVLESENTRLQLRK